MAMAYDTIRCGLASWSPSFRHGRQAWRTWVAPSLWYKVLHTLLGITNDTYASYISTFEFLCCYQNILNHELLLIIDSGTSMCITPRKLDFFTYKPSMMKIKDSSSSNEVAGKGLLRWKVEDVARRVVNLDLPGYHKPDAEVSLQSPQVLLLVFSGHNTQTKRKVEVCLGNSLVLHAQLCPVSCIPLLPFVPGGRALTSFIWTHAFAYSTSNAAQAKTILGSAN
jgi:hypothetical protein